VILKPVVTRFTPAKLAAWLLAVTTLFAPLAATARAQVIEDNANGQTQEADGLGLAHDSDEAGEEGIRRRGGDDFKSPRAAERNARRQEALKQRLAGSRQTGRVHEVAKGQYVELGLEKTDKIFVILVEYGSGAGAALPAAAGPLHNQIPEPNRALDNNTIWQANYDRAHYEDMYFNRMSEYYRTQSSGRYTVNGQVTEWVKVPFNGYRYGTNALGDPAAWTLIADAVNTWTKDQLASGKTLDEVKAYLQSFDNWDRYDYDHDGNFDEPDGYIDHFQIVHSGAGEETGGGTLGAAAIWSHRWQAWYNFGGVTGPSFNKDGGVEFGGGWGANPNGGTFGSSGAAVRGVNTASAAAATVQNAHPINHTGVWVGDYTVQPENGGLGVFAHEYGHDLGLPDHYDRNGGSNATGFWTIMSSGSYLGDGTTDIGSRPGDFGAWDKLQLGWLNYEVADPSKNSSVKLGPAETNTRQAQAVVVPLPADKNVFYLYDPAVGSLAYGTRAWWGGKGDLIDNTMTRSVAVPAGASALTMRLNYQIENNWDYAYVSVSNDGGNTWANLAGTYLNGSAQSPLTTNTNPNANNLGNGITGSTNNAWRLASFNTTPYAGQTVLLRLRYKTDELTSLKGIMADEIKLGPFADGAETGDGGWTFNGFKVTSGVENSNAPHYYIAEFRQYRTYDAGLQTGPYTFGRSGSGLPSTVDHYPYQDGLLVWYWDAGEADNDTSLHRGEGLVLPVDSHPEPLLRNVQYPGQAAFTSPWSSTVQTYDSTFGIEPTDAVTLPFSGALAGTVYQFFQTHPSLPGVPVFNDNNAYWYTTTPTAGVIVPKTGTTIRVVSTSAQNNFMQVQVGPQK
jgi:immune inhibitor A